MVGSNLDGTIFAHTLNVANGHGGHTFLWCEHTNDGRWFVTALFVSQCVAIQCAHALHAAAIDGLLLEFLTQLELDDGVLECRLGVKLVVIAVLDQEDRWCGTVADHTGEVTDA